MLTLEELCIIHASYIVGKVNIDLPLHFQNNTFQVAVATDNSNTVAVFNYLDDGLNWYQADEDYYDYTEDDPDFSPVQVGFNKGGEGGIFYTLSDYTLTPSVLKLDDYSNRDRAGQWTFAITNENVTTGEQIITTAGQPGDMNQLGLSVKIAYF